jgi:aspartyl-tRNA(Asn)/glutamyl-tRNA(Gln) amidotransferase subunit A
MTKIDIETLTIEKAHESLVSGDYTALELTEAYLAQAKKANEETNAYVEIFDDCAEQARHADEILAKQGKDAPLLTGIPMAIKDIIMMEGRTVTAGSHILEGHVATYDANVIEELKKAGVVFIGRANMDEFAMGGSNETSYYGPAKNPHDTTRVPGGSSGGSAAAVAMHGALGALGTDTGGSIRQPASLCGVVGLKPTYGAVSRRGAIAMASSLDQIGPFAPTVDGVEAIFDCISTYDKQDSTSVPRELREEMSRDVKAKMTIGVPKDFVYSEGVDEDVLENFKETLEKLEKAGHTVKEIELPNIAASLAVYYVIMPAEASTNLARFDGMRYGLREEADTLYDVYAKTRAEGFGAEVKRRIMLGTYVLSSGYYDAYYNKANAVRDVLRKDLDDAFKDVDVIVTPTSPTPAFKIGEKTDDPLSMYLADIFTVPINLTGIPGISVPSGTAKRDGKDLPLGFQIMAPHFCEDVLFSLARDVEKLAQ